MGCLEHADARIDLRILLSFNSSPLSAAMSIWAMQKFWQIPALRAVVRGRWIRIVTAIKNSTHTSSGLVRWKRSCKSSTKVTRAEQQQRTADTQSHTVSGMVVMTTIHPAQDSPLMAQLLQKYNGSDAAMVLEHVSFSKTVLQVSNVSYYDTMTVAMIKHSRADNKLKLHTKLIASAGSRSVGVAPCDLWTAMVGSHCLCNLAVAYRNHANQCFCNEE